MKKYFKFIGIVELIVFAIGLILYIIGMVQGFSAVKGDGVAIATYIFALVALVIFGPAVGLLFCYIGSDN